MTRWMTWLMVLSVCGGMLLCAGLTEDSTARAAENECGKDEEGNPNLLTIYHSSGELVPDELEEEAPGAITTVVYDGSPAAYIRIDVCVPEMPEIEEEEGEEEDSEEEGEGEEKEMKGDVSLGITGGAEKIELSELPGGVPLLAQEMNFSASVTLWGKAIAASDSEGDIEICAKFAERCEDLVKVTAMPVDLDAHRPGTIEAPGELVPDGDEEDPQNLVVALNLDDDNEDGIADSDREQSLEVAAEDDDLIRLVLRHYPQEEGTLELSMGWDGLEPPLRLFTADGSQEISRPLTVDLTEPDGPLSEIGHTDVVVLAEALDRSDDISVELVYAVDNVEMARDEVHLMAREIEDSQADVDLDAYWPGTRSEPGSPVSDEKEEDLFHLFLAVNDDDDNFDTVADNDPADSPFVEPEDDDLMMIVVRKFTPPVAREGTLELNLSEGLRLFREDGAQELELPLSVDLADPEGPLADVEQNDVAFLIEATQAFSNAALHLAYISAGEEIARDEVRLSVVNPGMTGGFTRGSIRYSQVEKVNANWVVCGEFTPNRPLSVLIENPAYSLEGMEDVPAETLYNLALRFSMTYGVSTERDFWDVGKWNRPTATQDALLISERYFELQAALYNGLIAPINVFLQLLGRPLLETYDAETLAESLSQESGIPKEDLLLGKYFVTGSLYEPGRGAVEFFVDREAFFLIEDLYLLKLDLDIHHGGQDRTEVPDAEEETRGAVARANLNDSDGDGDTDGDGVVDQLDKDDPEILTSDWWWFEEGDPDMMKLVMRPIEPVSLVKELKLKNHEDTQKLSLTVNSGNVRLWEKPSKEGTEICSEKSCTFDLAELEKNVWIEALEVSAVDRDIRVELEYLGAKDSVRATAAWDGDVEGLADLAIDSDNNNGFDVPPTWEPSEYEDSIEDEEGKPGKFIAVNDGDADNDGVPDVADFDTSSLYPGNQPVEFTPLLVQLPESANLDETRIQLSYSASDPTKVIDPNNAQVYRPEPGYLRIWTTDGMSKRNVAEVSKGGPGHYVKPETFYPASVLGSKRKLILFVEGVRESASLGDQQISVKAESKNAEGGTIILEGDSVRTTVLRVDLDIDSDNNAGFTVPSGIDYDEEDHIEDIQENDNRPGKLIAANMGDADNDNIPDFADPEVVVEAGADPVRFTPLVLTLPEPLDLEKVRIRFDYSASSAVPTDLRSGEGTPEDPYVYNPAPGHLRIWKVDGSVARTMADINAPDGGHFVQSGSVYKATDLGPGRTITLYLEGIGGSATLADQQITVEIDPNEGNETPGFLIRDTVRTTVVNLEITEIDLPNTEIDLPNDGVSFTTRDEPPNHIENEITLTANIEPDSFDAAYNPQIQWEIRDNPMVNGESPQLDISNLQGEEITIEMNIENDADGRNYPLNYQIQARFLFEGNTVYSQWKPILQDARDELRQQYLDMNYNHFPMPERDELVLTENGNPEFIDATSPAYWNAGIEGLVDGIEAEYGGVFVFVFRGGSGFRSPIHNEDVSTANPRTNSHHAYGRAADCHFRDENGNGSTQDEWGDSNLPPGEQPGTLYNILSDLDNVYFYVGREEGGAEGTGWFHVQIDHD